LEKSVGVETISSKIKNLFLLNKTFWGSFLVLFSTYFVWWWAFFPGIMTSDSYDQWQEVITFHFKNASPYIYAFIMSILRVFHDSPAPMAMFQILLFTTAISLFINYASKKGVSKFLLMVTVLFFAVWPQFGIYNVSIWKDIMYSIMTLIMGLLFVLYFLDDKAKESRWLLVSLAAATAFVALFRHNGLPFLLLPSLALAVFRTVNIKKALTLFVLTLLVYFSFSSVLFNILKVQSVPAMKDGLMIKNIGGIYHLANPNLTVQERQIFEKMSTEKEWKTYYDCTSINAMVHSVMRHEGTGSYSPRLVKSDKDNAAWQAAFVSASLRNPMGFITDRACQANNMLGILTMNNFRYADTSVRGAWHPVVNYDSKNPGLRETLREYLRWTAETQRKSYIFWATWPMVIINLGAIAVALRKKLKGLGLYSLFILINLAIVMAVAPAIDYRYIYFVYVCTPFIPIIYLLETKRRGNK